MLRFLLDACGCFKQTTFYHQLEAQHLHERRRQEWGASRIPHLTLLYLRSAKLAPSPAPARADGGVVRDV